MFYRPEMENRFFRKGVKYKDIDWKNFKSVVENFKQRMEDWYLKPAATLNRQTWDNAFSVMAINCLLIDALSQFEAGKIKSSEDLFKSYVSIKMPDFGRALPVPINKKNGGQLVTFSDVLYVGFRCGIVHEAHIAIYGGIAGLGSQLCDVDTDICTKYSDGTDCPTVRMDPSTIFTELRKVFHTYIRDLTNKNPSNNQLRIKFKRKFKNSFGIDLSSSKL